MASIYLSFNWNAKNYKAAMHHDGLGYYMYLPHVFIDHGFELRPGEDETGYGTVPGTNLIFDKYSYGVSVMMLPFFLISHAMAPVLGIPADGYSYIYDIGMMMAAVFYLVLGLFFLIRTIARLYPPGIVIMALLAIYAGTNLYFYTIRDPAYSHVYSFFLFSWFIYLVPEYLKNPAWKRTVLLSFIFGWIFLIRPTNGVVFLYLLGHNVYTLQDVKQRFAWIRLHFLKLCLLPVAAIIWFIPQLVYWHAVLGKWQFYAYRHEGFIYWTRPKIFHVLFSVQNGMVIYAPVALFAVIGLMMGWYRKKISAPAILFILGVSTYVFGSWWCWWYGGAYGHRGFIEYFSFMSMPIAYVLSRIIKLKPAYRMALLFLFFLCIFYSMQLNYAYSWPWEGPGWTWRALGKVLLKTAGI